MKAMNDFQLQQEKEIKERAHEAARLAQARTPSSCGETTTGLTNECVRPNLRQRVADSLYLTRRNLANESALESALQELSLLLEINPDVARILELIESTHSY
jgi:hypothetical protein